MSQLGLFDRAGAPYVKNSDTSKEAADSILLNSKTLRGIVFAYIKGANGCTCDEVETALEMKHQTASARIRELSEAGYISDKGKRRPTRSGRLAVVWIPT
jgi:predicted HTH transcriptional regulator